MNMHPRLGVALVLLAAALWGTTGTSQALASGQLSSLWFGALRVAVASLFFAGYAAWTRGRGSASPQARPLPIGALAAAGACMAAYNLAFFAGVRLTGVAVGTAVAIGSGPVWAGLLQALVQRSWPSRLWWTGTVLAIAGGAGMALAGTGATARLGAGGIALCLLSGLSYAGYAMIGKRLTPQVPAATFTLMAFTVAAALALPAAWWDGGAPRWQARDAAAVLYVGVFTAGVAYLLFAHALRHISAATGVTLALAEPVVAFALAVTLLGQPLAAGAVGGLLLVVVGVLLVVRVELHGAPAGAGAGPVLPPGGPAG